MPRSTWRSRSGLNFMDTAELYAVPGSPETSGRTEEIIGNWFAKDRQARQMDPRQQDRRRRHQIPAQWRSAPMAPRSASPSKQSLKRLKTDHIDLYQIHWASRGHYNFENGWTYAPHNQDTADVTANLLDMLANPFRHWSRRARSAMPASPTRPPGASPNG